MYEVAVVRHFLTATTYHLEGLISCRDVDVDTDIDVENAPYVAVRHPVLDRLYRERLALAVLRERLLGVRLCLATPAGVDGRPLSRSLRSLQPKL